uniref:Uncharacterized protein n=1 Tax=Panagrolaimus sp. ES5 TaxID=591445 RepID=A0AC34FMZ1_9BILA
MSRNLVIGIQFMPSSTVIVVQKYDLTTDEEDIDRIEYDIKKNGKNVREEFFDKIRSKVDLRQVKAISFMFIDYLWFPDFETAYAFRLKCKSFCEINGIFYHFTTASTIQCLYALSSTKTMVQNGQQVTILHLNPIGEIGGTTVIRKNGCYYFYESLTLKKIVYTEEWKTQFLGDSNPTKIIFVENCHNQSSNSSWKKLKEVFKDKTVVISKDYAKHFAKYTAEHVLHVMGEKLDVK